MAFDPSTARPLEADSGLGGDGFELPPLEPTQAPTTRFNPATAKPYTPPLGERVKGWASTALTVAEPELAGAVGLLKPSEPKPSTQSVSRREFIESIRPHAERVGAQIGVPPEYLIAHAAQETGWGKHAPNNNLFGIKGRYRGQGQELNTTEGVNTPERTVFRAYPSAAESFDDLGALLRNPRYAGALKPKSVEDYASGLVSGGYATDPHYARNIGDRLREYRDAMGQEPTAGDYGRVLAGSAGALVPETLAGLGRMESGAERATGIAALGQEQRAAIYGWLGDLAKSTRDYWESGMTPAGREQLLKGELIRADTDPATGETSYRLGDNPGQTILASALESAPGIFAMGSVGKAALSGLGFTAERVAAQAVEHGVAPGLAGWLGKVATSGAAYGGAEGLISGAQDAEQTYRDFMAIPAERYTQLPAFRKAFLESDRGLPLPERQKQAWQTVAERAAMEVGVKSGAVVGFTSAATGGGMFGALESPSRTALGGVAKSALVEAGQEAPQSAYEQLAQNQARRDYIDPSQSIWEGVPNAAATGAAVGGLFGAATGGFMGGGGQEAGQPAPTPPQAPEQNAIGVDDGSGAALLGGAQVAPEMAQAVDAQGVEGGGQVAPQAAPEPAATPAPTEADLREASLSAQEAWDTKLTPEKRQTALNRVGVQTPGLAGTPFFELPQEAQGALIQARLQKMAQAQQPLPAGKPRKAKAKPGASAAPADPAYDADVPPSWPVGPPAGPIPGAGPIDDAAHTAATSPLNGRPEPTQAQKEAGNYKKGHVRAFGLDLSIENPQGSERKGVDQGGKPWSIQMRDHYGYIKGTVGRDKDPIDLFIKPGTPADHVGPLFIVDQVGGDGRFDEHKVMAGYPNAREAKRAYLRNYTPGWKGLGAMSEMSPDEFKTWLASGKTRRPVAQVQANPVAGRPRLIVKPDGAGWASKSGVSAEIRRRKLNKDDYEIHEGGEANPGWYAQLVEGVAAGQPEQPSGKPIPTGRSVGKQPEKTDGEAKESSPVEGAGQGRQEALLSGDGVGGAMAEAEPGSEAADGGGAGDSGEADVGVGDESRAGMGKGSTPAVPADAAPMGLPDQGKPEESPEAPDRFRDSEPFAADRVAARARLDRDIRGLEALRRRVARCVAA